MTVRYPMHDDRPRGVIAELHPALDDNETMWVKWISEWRASGQSAAEFTRGREYSVSALRYWTHRLKRLEAPRVARAVVETEASRGRAVVEIGGARLIVEGVVRSMLRTFCLAFGSWTDRNDSAGSRHLRGAGSAHPWSARTAWRIGQTDRDLGIAFISAKKLTRDVRPVAISDGMTR